MTFIFTTLFRTGPWRELLLLCLLPAVGTLGFYSIEGWSFFDSLYMSIITLSTVGFMEVHPLSTMGRFFVICYLVVGLSSFLYAVARMGEWLSQSGVSQIVKHASMQRRLARMNDHFLICGFGQMGQRISEELWLKGQQFIVIDKDIEALELAKSKRFFVYHGDATDDICLQECQLASARGLCSVLSEDADNLLVVLTAKLLAPKLHIISRVIAESNERKLIKAGASKVINLYHAGAMKAFKNLINPNFLDLMEIESGNGLALEVAEIKVEAKSTWQGKSEEDFILNQEGIVLVGIRKSNGVFHMGGKKCITFETDDTVILAGFPKSLLVYLNGLNGKNI